MNLYNYLCLHRLMLIQISHRSYRAYYPYVLQGLYWYFLSYTYTYSRLILIQNLYLKHSNLIPIANLFLFGTYTYNILILYLLRSYTHGRLILIPISRKTQIYSDSLYTVLNIYIYLYLSPVRHIFMLVLDIYLFRSPKGHIFRTYTDTCLRPIIIQIS